MAKQVFIWSMDARGNARRVAACNSLTEARDALATPKLQALRKGYLYLQIAYGNGKFRYPWNCVSGKVYKGDLRAQVLDVLRKG